MAESSPSPRSAVDEAARSFVDRALRADDSLFTPGKPIWSLAGLDDLYAHFVANEDPSKEDFLTKLQGQLIDAPPGTIQLAAEILFVYFLGPSGVHGATKRAQVEQILHLLPAAVDLPPARGSALDAGLANYGAAGAQKVEHLRFLIRFVRAWKQLRGDEQARALDDCDELKRVVDQVSAHAAHGTRNILLHLIHPDCFEPIASRSQKQKLIQAFPESVDPNDPDVDHQIARIRKSLEPTHGPGFSFYDDNLRQRWQIERTPWDVLATWAGRFFSKPTFDADEREYKLTIAERLQTSRAALVSGSPTWRALLKRAFGAPNNLTSHFLHGRVVVWCNENPVEAEAAFRAFWESDAGIRDRIDHLGSAIPRDVHRGGMANLGSFLAMALDPTTYPIYQQTVYRGALTLVGLPAPQKLEAGAEYDRYLSFLDTVYQELTPRHVAVRDRLDAQSLLWCVTKAPPEKPPLASWPPTDREALLAYRQGQGAIEDIEDEDGTDDPHPKPVVNFLATLADELLIDEAFLRGVSRLLEAKGQVIFTGPPGTGKTYLARRLGQVLAGPTGDVEIIQFHPSYAYEDFVEGYRPVETAAGEPGFAIKPGALRRIAAKARSNPHAKHILIIDEINRGNLPKVFGELYYLLEYRLEKITLQYSEESFSLPPNLWIIGTMNTSDRSLALLDAALRRRFYFVDFFPDQPPFKDLLARWLDRNKPALQWVSRVVDKANVLLADRQSAIGPSYFMRLDLDDEWVSLIWDHSILPTLADRFFGDEARLAEFGLDRLRAQLNPGE